MVICPKWRLLMVWERIVSWICSSWYWDNSIIFPRAEMKVWKAPAASCTRCVFVDLSNMVTAVVLSVHLSLSEMWVLRNVSELTVSPLPLLLYSGRGQLHAISPVLRVNWFSVLQRSSALERSLTDVRRHMHISCSGLCRELIQWHPPEICSMSVLHSQSASL